VSKDLVGKGDLRESKGKVLSIAGGEKVAKRARNQLKLLGLV